MRRLAFALILAATFVSILGSDAAGEESAGNPCASVQYGIDMVFPGDDVYVGSRGEGNRA